MIIFQDFGIPNEVIARMKEALIARSRERNFQDWNMIIRALIWSKERPYPNCQQLAPISQAGLIGPSPYAGRPTFEERKNHGHDFQIQHIPNPVNQFHGSRQQSAPLTPRPQQIGLQGSLPFNAGPGEAQYPLHGGNRDMPWREIHYGAPPNIFGPIARPPRERSMENLVSSIVDGNDKYNEGQNF